MTAVMFHVKICGITNADDARAVARAGAGAAGLNFYAKSPRCVSPDGAREILAALPASMVKVGVFVNAEAEEVGRLFDELRLDLIQLHGDEPPEYLARLGGRPVMRAFRVDKSGLATVTDYLQKCRALGAEPVLALFDAPAGRLYGGTGKSADWKIAREFAALPDAPPLVLAGGLTPENVAEAIRAVRPAAVDVAGGVESSPGRKDPARVEAFVRAAEAANRG